MQNSYLALLKGHSGSVVSIHALRDDPFIVASLAEDSKLHLWDLRNAKPSLSLGHEAMASDEFSNIACMGSEIFFCCMGTLCSVDIKKPIIRPIKELDDSCINGIYIDAESKTLAFCTDGLSDEGHFRTILFRQTSSPS